MQKIVEVTSESEKMDTSEPVAKRRKTRDIFEEAVDELQEDISSHINSLLGELHQKKSKKPIVIVSSPPTPIASNVIMGSKFSCLLIEDQSRKKYSLQ
jgi:hypothetical protein